MGATTSEDALNEELSTGRIGLAVLFAGSGMKVKILNYCASGLPVITTSVGAEGYENIKSLIVVPPTPTSVAEAIVFIEIAQNFRKNRQTKQGVNFKRV